MSADYGRKGVLIQFCAKEGLSKSFICPLPEKAFILCPRFVPKEFNQMLKPLTTTRISNRVMLLLVSLSFAVSFIHTCFEWHWLSEAFKIEGLEIYPVHFRTSLCFTIILFGATLSAISSRLSKIALVLMTIVFVAYWVMVFENRSELPRHFDFERNLTFVPYQLVPLIALLVGYVTWMKRYNYRSIALTGLLCVISQFFIWFIDTRLMANADAAGTSYQYPPITINATFFGATWGHVILLVLCTATMLALVILMKRDWRNKEGEKS
ncbi:MAG: hypothetical protein ABI977_08065 [Acidobacteriota bacterium]